MPLSNWFAALAPAAIRYGGVLGRWDATARTLLATATSVCCTATCTTVMCSTLARVAGWRSIRKNLVGERGFDFANMFTNPDLDDPSRPVATLPGVFAPASISSPRRRGWSAGGCCAGTSPGAAYRAAWFLDDGLDATIDLQVAELVAAELDR